MKINSKHRVLSIILSVLMVLSLMPVAVFADSTKGTKDNPYTREEFSTMTRTGYIAAQEELGGTMYVDVGDYSYDKTGTLGNGTTDNSDKDSTKLNYYAANGYRDDRNDGANDKTVVFIGKSITSGVTGYASIDNIGTSLVLAVPAYTNVRFEGITFNNVFSFAYQLYTSPWSQLSNLTFDNCTFNGIIVGGLASNALEFNKCTFNNYTNTIYANNSNPTWIRPAYGNWTKGDNEVQGEDFKSLTSIKFTDNTVTSTRPVKFERIAQWDMDTTVTATGNDFNISKQDGDNSTKNVGMYLGANSKFDLVAEGNRKSDNTAALFTAVYQDASGKSQAGLPSGSTVKNTAGEDVTITDALEWKTDTALTLKTTGDEPAVATIDGVGYASLDDAINAAVEGSVIVLSAGEYKLNRNLTYTGKAFTIKAADGAEVSFDMSAAVALHGAKITFEGVTFDYKTNGNYIGLQHTDTLVYNNCVIKGMAFLYATNETFNGCTFKQTSADAYNVWTYGAKNVEFNGCTFNCVGKSVLVYNEGANPETHLTVVDTDFIASAPVEGKAAIEIDTSRMADGATITIDDKTTADGFASGSNSGSLLWNDKKQTADTNKDVTVTVAGETVFAPKASVAQIGDAKYATVAEAIAAAKAGDTVALLADVTEDVVINKNITFDLGGKTLTNTNAGKATISVQNGATVTVTNGNVVGGTSYYNIEVVKGSNANLTLTGVTATAGNTGSSMIDNWGTLTITSGTYTGGLNVVKSEEGSTLLITGGDFTLDYAPSSGYTAVILVYGDTTITSGTFTQTATPKWGYPQVVMTGVVEGYTAITRVTGGTFVNKKSGDNIFHGFGKATSDNFRVSGGTFNKSISDAYCADGFIPTKNADGTYGVKEGKYVAKVVSTKYETLADAIRLAARGKTVTLLCDIDENVTVAANKKITIDLNGYTLNGGTGTSTPTILNRGTLTITDSSADKTGTIKRADRGIEGEISYYVIMNNGTMTIENAIVTNNSGYKKTNPYGSMAGSSLICNEGTDATESAAAKIAVLNIKGGTFTQYNFIAVKNSSNAELNVSGGVINSKHSAVQNWYKANITGGELNGQLWTDAWDETSTGKTVVSGDAKLNGEIVMDITGSIAPTLEISGGSHNVTWKVTTAAANAGAKPQVSGGTFKAAVPEDYCAYGFIPTKNADGTYTVKSGSYVAETGGIKYESLEEAIAAAKDGDTVKLLSDCSGNGIQVETNKFANEGLTVDFGGHTYTVGGVLVGSAGTGTNAFQLLKDNYIVFMNGTIAGVTENTKPAEDTPNWHGAPAIVIQNYANLTLKNMSVVGGDETVYTVTNNNGDVVIEDTVITAGKAKGYTSAPVAFDVCRYASYPAVTVTVKGNSVINGDIEVSGKIGNDQSRQLNIENGTFNGEFKVANTPANIAISGGKFSTEIPEDYCADGFIPTKNEDGSYGVIRGTYVVEVNGTKYTSLVDAYNAADNGATITLLGDCSSERINLENKSITVALNGYTLKSTAAYGVMFCAKNGNTITVDGTVEGSKLVGTIMITNGTDGHIVLNGGTYENSQYCPVYVNGAVSTDNSTVTVTDAVIIAAESDGDEDVGVAVYLAGYSKATFTNTTITATVTGIEIRAGELTVNNCTVTGGNGEVVEGANGNGTTVANAAIAISQHNTKKDITVNINGGTFTASAAVYQSDVQGTGSEGVKAKISDGTFNGKIYAATSGAMEISGGTFSSEVSRDYCASNFKPVQNEDGSYTVKKATITITVSSSIPGAGTLTGGDKYVAGETVTITAKVKSGFEFIGWYDTNGKLITKDASHEFTAAEDAAYVATFKGTAKVKLSVDIGRGNVKATYDGKTVTWRTDIKYNEFAVGTKFTLEAVPSSGYKFLYWINAEGRIVSYDKTYEFTITDNTTELEACYVEETQYDDASYVVFRDEVTNRILWMGDVNNGEYVDLPTILNLDGYKFDGWYDENGNAVETVNGQLLVTENIVVIAKYTKNDTMCVVTVNGVEQGKYVYGTSVTVTAPEVTGKYFSGWKIGNTLVSTNATYSFIIKGNVDLVAEYSDTPVESKVVINASVSDRTTLENGKQTVVITVAWSMPDEGFELIRAGFIRAYGEENKGNLTLDKVDKTTIISSDSNLKTNEGTYTYTLTMGSVSSQKDLFTVGYITYRDTATDEIVTVYTDIAASYANAN